jgi:copper chaperone NosL
MIHMKAKILCGFFIVAFLLTGFSALAQTAEDIKKHPNCTYCGMDREKFNYSRMLNSYNDDSEFGSCSIHCAAIDLAVSMGKSPKSILVADYNTKKLIDAEKATWVIGGKKPGVMTKVAKWAFEKPEDAMAFVKENEGKVAKFDDAMRSSYEDMYADTKMIRAKKAEMKKMQQEKKP